jgi:oligoendopeptidase F
MSSPINMQQSVLQTVVTERVQQVQQQHPDMQQRYFEHQLTQERIKKLHKVNDYDEMERIRLRDNEEKRQHKDQQKNRDTEKPAPETEASISPDQPGRVNIKV